MTYSHTYSLFLQPFGATPLPADLSPARCAIVSWQVRDDAGLERELCRGDNHRHTPLAAEVAEAELLHLVALSSISSGSGGDTQDTSTTAPSIHSMALSSSSGRVTAHQDSGLSAAAAAQDLSTNARYYSSRSDTRHPYLNVVVAITRAVVM